jgi:hypothetical protein
MKKDTSRSLKNSRNNSTATTFRSRTAETREYLGFRPHYRTVFGVETRYGFSHHSTRRAGQRIFNSLLVMLLVAGVSTLLAGDLTQSSRSAALFDSGQRLQNNLNVLMISLQPGFEDLEALAYFRLGRGAGVTSAYVTNGGLVEDARGDEYPHIAAARRRYQAAEACEKIGVETYFMNLPDLGAAADTTRVWEQWNRDSLKLGLLRLIAQTRPDIVLVTADHYYGAASFRWRVFREYMITLLRQLQRRVPSQYPNLLDADGWPVNRMLVEADSGLAFPTERVYLPLQKSYRQLAAEARKVYAATDALFQPRQQRLYGIAFMASSFRSPKNLEEGLPRLVGDRLRWLQQEARSIGMAVQRDFKRLTNLQRSETLVRRVIPAIDTAVYHLKHSYDLLSPVDRRALLHWNQSLEDLRILLLGIGISYSFSETVLTNSQLTFLTIDTVYGLPRDGTTEVYFPEVGKQWILNEALEQRIHLHREPYRLLSPRGMKYDLPAQEYGLEKNSVGTMFFFYLIHNNPVRWKSFVLPVKTRLWFAPKFTVELFNPIVRLQRNEHIVVRLTNHSRDGVADTLSVVDSLVTSSRLPFRLSTKGSSLVDTLKILQVAQAQEGSYLVGLEIGGERVGQFAARAIAVTIDSMNSVGLLTSLQQSVLAGSLRRLGVRWKRIDATEIPEPTSLRTLLVDRNSLPEDSTHRQALRRFAEQGGNLVILPQLPQLWNKNPLIPGMSLELSASYDENSIIEADSTNPYFSKPNLIARSDWDEWLWFRSYAAVTLHTSSVEIPARIQKDGNPALLIQRLGKGKITYVNLSLHPQLLNVHPGVLRLLANLAAS